VEEKINQLVQERAPWLVNGSFLSKTIYTFLKKFLKFGETIYVGDHIQGMSGAEAFNWLGSEYTSNCEIEGLENIPKDGKCLLVSNHPMGAADAVSLYHQIYKVREDAFFFANELFVYLLGSFKDVMAPVAWNKEKEIHSATKVTLERLNTFFGDERIGIIFPSGRLSKLTLFGVWDRPWEKTPITLAKKYDFPVIPVYIDAKNSWFFYFASYVNKQLRDVSQLNELLNKKEYTFTIKIGKPIKHTDLSSHNDIAIQQLRYKSESLKKGLFKLKRFLYLRQYKN
jgi:putative hemolysin